MSGGTEISSDQFESILTRWRKVNSKTNKTAIETQFEVIIMENNYNIY